MPSTSKRTGEGSTSRKNEVICCDEFVCALRKYNKERRERERGSALTQMYGYGYNPYAPPVVAGNQAAALALDAADGRYAKESERAFSFLSLSFLSFFTDCSF